MTNEEIQAVLNELIDQFQKDPKNLTPQDLQGISVGLQALQIKAIMSLRADIKRIDTRIRVGL